jgi:hypothetical protein
MHMYREAYTKNSRFPFFQLQKFITIHLVHVCYNIFNIDVFLFKLKILI